MFTGLVQGIGNLYSLDENTLKVTCLPDFANQILKDLEIGDSVAVDGVCLTAIEILSDGFIADASGETRDRSTLGRVQGALVNLEPSLRVGSKLGGHFVTGHVDGLGSLQSSHETERSWEMTFVTEQAAVARYILPKGSIAINGISLTVAECNAQGSWFTVAVIPHTYVSTNLQHLQPGSWVNLEGDLLGKYVDKFLRSPLPTPQALGAAASADAFMPSTLTPEFLLEHGYG